MRALSALPILAVLSFASTALADPPANTIMKVSPPDQAKNAAMDASVVCTHKTQMEIAQLGALEARLKLTPAQKPVFDTWRRTRVDLWRVMPCPSLPMGLEVPAPKRVENQVATMTASLEGLKRELPATEALYKALTPEQKAIFDGPMRIPAPVPPAAAPAAAEKPAAPAPAH
jgi:Spy/CpxP family protein refolding chaperone